MDLKFPNNLQNKIDEWLSWDKNEDTLMEIKEMIEKKEEDKLQSLMMTRLLFGTAGLRGRMGVGYSCMNDLVIIQTSQGLAKYVLSTDAKGSGIIIGYDSRYNSKRFAQLTASVFLSCGIPVYLFSKICPTPFVPFTVVQYGCLAGVMVTASHNPKEDNGYKVYWNNGAQIIPPHDANIQQSIENHLRPFDGVWNISKSLSTSNLTDPIDDINEKYFKMISSSVLDSNMNAQCPLNFTHTSMHGVVHSYMVKAFEVCNFKPFIPVKEQMEPDPEFPTVKFPNPEEGKSALDLAIATANENNSSIIVASDPDADRLAVAEKLKTGVWKVFTGNEEGALLGWWSWYRCQQLNPAISPKNIYMVASTVSSEILNSIANKEGFNFVETLTGFKWMCNKAYNLIEEGKTVIFAFEEAIGYMMCSEVLDKDGVSAAVRLAEMAAYLDIQGMTLYEKLLDIYKTYGFHSCNNSYYICYNQETIVSIFDRLRNFETSNKYPDSVKNGKYIVKDVRDLTVGFDSSKEGNEPILPVSPDGQMITFYFTNECVLTMRTSGTEPKIKYYSEIWASPSNSDWKALEEELNELVEAAVQEWLEPLKNNLIAKAQ